VGPLLAVERLSMTSRRKSGTRQSGGPAPEGLGRTDAPAIDPTLQQVRRIFYAETEEDLAIVEASLLELERAPDDRESLASVFRKVHSLKGNALSVGFSELGKLAHRLEDLLDNLRSGKEAVTPTHISFLLGAVDALREALSGAMAGREELPASCRAIREQIDDGRLVARTDPDTPGVAPEGERPAEASTTLRIKTTRLDDLLNMTTEIAVAQGRLGMLVAKSGDPELVEAYTSMARLLTEHQHSVTRVRLVPLAPIFRWHSRVVRDVALAQGKQVDLVVVDQGVEVDTSVVEQLKAPLTHMVRNAVSHGIESPEVRREKGKSPTGRVELRARHEEGGVAVEVADDGAGLDRGRILTKARELRLVPEGTALTDAEVDALVFEPGLSTAESVTSVSGRGVGMDVVIRHLDAIGGSVEVRSRSGEGTCFTIRMPLTLAIIDGFLLAVGDETYVMPMAGVVRCVDLAEGRERTAADGVLNMEGQAVPFIRLRSAFDISAPHAKEIAVVARTNGQLVGIAADRLLGKQQVVVTPLARQLGELRRFSGLTILADGTVAPIISLPGLVEGRRLAERAVEAELANA
jgi:two-component system chemotaxis sensor kinase CheA